MANKPSYVGIDKNTGKVVAFSAQQIINENIRCIPYADFCASVGISVTDELDTFALYVENGTTHLDKNWERGLMPARHIMKRHQKRLIDQIDEELKESAPDLVKLAALIRDSLKIPLLSEKDIYQIALESLQYADIPKPEIEAKLEAKIAELGS